MKNIFKGMGVALLTPFRPALTPSGCEVDYEKIEELVEYIISNGADFICLLGSTAETACLSAEEKKQIKDVVCKSANKRVPLLIGMGDNNTSRLIEEINSFDFTALLIIPENQSQLTACSGKSPVCLKLKGFR